MARFARVVLPHQPHHVVHRGNRRQPIFFTQQDRDTYLDWLNTYSLRAGLEVWAYCLMTNHVHLLVVGERTDSMAFAIGRTHMRYARHINRRHGWTGHLWANRYHSTVLDETHLWRAVRYVELNPVRAGMVQRAEEYPWSSARTHCSGGDDPILAVDRPFPGPQKDWGSWLAQGLSQNDEDRLRKSTTTGRPCGSDDFILDLEERLGRRLRPQRRGREAELVAEIRHLSLL